MLTFVRVSYGEKNKPMEEREYRLNGQGPVGCIDEICQHFKQFIPLEGNIVFLKDMDGSYKLDLNTGKFQKE